MPNTIASLIRLVFILTVTFPCGAEIKSTTVNILSQKDNTLYEDPAGALSNGAGYYFFSGRTSQLSNSVRRGVIAFDIASNIPSGAVIVDVQLTLFMSRVSLGAPPAIIELHRLLADWGEGTSDALGEEGGGALSTTNDATWIHSFFDTGFWTSPGANFDMPVSSSTVVNSVGFYTFPSTSTMIADVQNWLDTPSGNFGWTVMVDETVGGSSRRFSCKEDTLASNRPILSVSYVPPPCCIGNRGDINNDGADANILDLTYLVDRIFRGGPPPVCAIEADVNSDGAFANILDLTYLVDRIFRGGPPPGPC